MAFMRFAIRRLQHEGMALAFSPDWGGAMSKRNDLDRFYALMRRLSEKRPAEPLRHMVKHRDFPGRGVYFFFDPNEWRSDGSQRVVRVGTHALTSGSQSSLWGRLGQHRGTRNPKGGNHRGSIFRLLVGKALLARSGEEHASWGDKKLKDRATRDAEVHVEQLVSDYLGALPVLCLDIADDAGPQSLRGLIERNSIALLSNYHAEKHDPMSVNWLGHDCDRPLVRQSELWNNKHVTEQYDPTFLDVLERLIDDPKFALGAPLRGCDGAGVGMSGSRASEGSAVLLGAAVGDGQEVVVIQCAKRKQADGWFRDKQGRRVRFVASPNQAPQGGPDLYAHPDEVLDDGVTWRERVAAYNVHYQATGDNPYGLHSAGDLYAHPRYRQLMKHFGPNRLYILSAGWGLVRSDYLLPNYDVTFSQAPNVDRYALRRNDLGWDDWSMLNVSEGSELIFVGGGRYLPQFVRLTAEHVGKRVAYFNSQSLPVASGVDLRRFETPTKTNWHYELAEKLIGGDAPILTVEVIAVPQRKTARSSRSGVKRGPKSGSRGLYAPLTAYLRALPSQQGSVTLSFSEIEAILGRSLPNSAHAYIGVWWSNGHHTQSAGWMDADFRRTGYHAASDREHSWVRFERV